MHVLEVNSYGWMVAYMCLHVCAKFSRGLITSIDQALSSHREEYIRQERSESRCEISHHDREVPS